MDIVDVATTSLRENDDVQETGWTMMRGVGGDHGLHHGGERGWRAEPAGGVSKALVQVSVSDHRWLQAALIVSY